MIGQPRGPGGTLFTSFLDSNDCRITVTATTNDTNHTTRSTGTSFKQVGYKELDLKFTMCTPNPSTPKPDKSCK